jgi:hypothetical protein
MKRLRLKRPFSSQGCCGSDCRRRPLIAQIEFDRRKTRDFRSVPAQLELAKRKKALPGRVPASWRAFHGR